MSEPAHSGPWGDLSRLLPFLVLFLIPLEPASSGVPEIHGDAWVQFPQDTSHISTKLSRRAKALQQKVAVRDTTRSAADSLRLKQLAVLPRDSSARLAVFHHVRLDPIAVAPLRPRPHPLYLKDPSVVEYLEVLDTLQYRYRLRRTVGGIDIRVPFDLSFEEYRDLRMTRTLRNNWETLAQEYKAPGSEKKQLSDIFGQITNIEIPVPKNPLFSIFGKNQINIHFNGSVDIHGAFRNTKSDLVTQNPLDQSRSEPDFDQQVRIGLKGEIGDKLTIDADWDTERTFEYENQLKVRYKGYDDEIVQSVEAGNVSLATNSSFISSSQALFGIKAGFQFGPLKLTTVASQKRGQIKELSVSGGGRPTPFERRPYEYTRNHFFVDTVYRTIYEKALKERPLLFEDANKQIQDIEVWVSRTGIIVYPNDRDAVAFIDVDTVLAYQNNPAARESDIFSVSGRVENSRFTKLIQGTDYTYDQFLGTIALNQALQPEQIIAVAYSLPTHDVGTLESKDTSKTTRLILKLVRPRNLEPSMKPAWDLMLKNIYSLGGRGIKKEGFSLDVKYILPGQDPVSEVTVSANGKSDQFNLLHMLFLDSYDENGAKKPDNKFDFEAGITIDIDRGELIFPTLEPFGNHIRDFFLEKFAPTDPAGTGNVLALADSFIIREVYDTTYNGAQNSGKNRFVITGVTVSSVASTYNIGFNVVEGSVEVLVDGQASTPNVDFTVDYLTGTVVIRNQSFLVPGKRLQIKYEANDLFQLASKSLMGARGELALAKNTALGFTVMSLNQQTLSDKVRLGEEPISNTIMGIDGGTNLNLDWLTEAMNKLPGIRTNAPSSISIRGEAAYILPDPNTRKSNIAQDNQKGIAFIDDFEGSRRTIPLGINYGFWRDASPPAYIGGLDQAVPVNGFIDLNDPAVRAGLLQDTIKMEYKARLTWFNIQPSDVFIQDIWPNRQTRAGQDFVTVMNLFYRPGARGPYNYSMNLADSLFAFPEKGWAGIQHLLGTSATNLLDENITFIELWVRVEQSSPNARLNINLGTISEDVIPNRILNSEDGLGGTIKTGLIQDPKQDVGLDMQNDTEERASHPAFIARYPEYSEDPSGDNYLSEIRESLNPLNHEGARGTDGNKVADGGQFPDTEDLNSNNVVDRTNSYFEYELALDTTSAGFRQYVTGGGANNWYQIRIPIKEFTRKIGNPVLTNIEAIRLWMTGADANVHLRMTEFNLVGNQWEALDKNDPKFRVSNVGIEENPSYTSPPGVQRPVDRTQPDQVISGNEQSLSLIVTDMLDGESKRAIKRYATRPLDLFTYKTLKLFVHGDDRPLTRMNFVDTTNYDVEFFFRFGADSLNYYEYRAPLRPGWAVENEITIRFEDVTALKLGRDTVGVLSRPVLVPGGAPGAVYRVLGQPALTNVRYLEIGVMNPQGKGSTSVTGEIWVNELRLTDVDDTPGWAYRFDTGIRLADIASINIGVTQRNPFFHGLEERFGTRNSDRSWTLASSIAFEKFLPDDWIGSQLSLTYSHVEGMQNPRYVPGTDILVEEAADRTKAIALERGMPEAEAEHSAQKIRQESRSLNVTETYALPVLKLSIPSSTWLVTETINRMNFAYSFTNMKRRSPTTEFFQQWSWSFRFGYNLQFSESTYLEPFTEIGEFFLLSPWKKAKFYFLPRNINVTAALTRSQTHEKARYQTQKKPIGRNFVSSRQLAFSWRVVEGGLLSPSVDYTLDIASSLVHLEVDRLGRQRSLGDILGDMFGGSRLIDFGVDLSYGQNISIGTKPAVPTFLKLNQIFGPTVRYSSRYDWQNNLQAGALGKSASATANVSGTLDVNLKTIADNIWSSQTLPKKPRVDSTGAALPPSLGERLDALSRVLFKAPFFDWDRLNITFQQTNSIRNNGILGRPGFLNLFGRVPFVQGSLDENGPSLLYQLGLSSDPHGRVVLKTRATFPFVTGYTVPGLRAPRGNLTDVFSQSNSVNMSTSRSLWEGATLRFTWNLQWSHNLNRTVRTDSLGVPTEVSRTTSGDMTRSYVTFPNTFIFKLFKTGIEDVNKRYERFKGTPTDQRSDDLKLLQAFEEGMEALPVSTKLISSIMPRPNWSFRWDGLEKMELFSSFASRVSLDHAYTSSFRRRWRLTTTGVEVTESEQVTQSFSPLVGLSVMFKLIGKGNLSANVRYGTSTTTDLAPIVQNITETNTTDINISATYSRSGFELPLFGLSLSNDLDISFSYSHSKNNRRVFDFKKIFKKDGEPLEGTIRTSMEPRIRYILSARVTASIYYKYSKLKPDAGGSRIPGSTINEGGLDIRVQIQ